MNYQVVPMDRSHIPAIAALERECFSRPWSEAALSEELYNDTACFLVAEGEDGTVLGYAGLHVILDEGYIEKLAFLTLEVRASNTPAIALYEKHGFYQVGRRKDYYDDPKEDALLLTREWDR